jgi:hypothetical protein
MTRDVAAKSAALQTEEDTTFNVWQLMKLSVFLTVR